jgi:NAD-dependent DNA ligase
MADTISSKGLQKIHFEQNLTKYEQYWIGFLHGILSSGKVENGEVEPLKAICNDFVERFDDPDADDLLQDLDAWPQDASEVHDFIQDIIFERSGGIDAMLTENSVPLNFFYGFMKGIACDNKIRIEELQGLIELGTADHSLIEEDPRVKEAINFSRYAIADMVITQEENDEICEYIARIVGDSFADTGIGLPNDIPQLDGTIVDVSEITYQGKNFVLTGSFDVPKRVFGEEIKKRGGVIQKTVTSSTDYLILAAAGSEHYVTPNAGTKIKAAVKLREKYGRLSFINERTIESLL